MANLSLLLTLVGISGICGHSWNALAGSDHGLIQQVSSLSTEDKKFFLSYLKKYCINSDNDKLIKTLQSKIYHEQISQKHLNQENYSTLSKKLQKELTVSLQLKSNILRIMNYLLNYYNFTTANLNEMQALKMLIKSLTNREIFIGKLLPLVGILDESYKTKNLNILFNFLGDVLPKNYKDSAWILEQFVENQRDNPHLNDVVPYLFHKIEPTFDLKLKYIDMETYFAPFFNKLSKNLYKSQNIDSSLINKIYQSYPYFTNSMQLQEYLAKLNIYLEDNPEIWITLNKRDLTVKALLNKISGKIVLNNNRRNLGHEDVPFLIPKSESKKKNHAIYRIIHNLAKYDFSTDLWNGLNFLFMKKRQFLNILPDLNPNANTLNTIEELLSKIIKISRNNPKVPKQILPLAKSLYQNIKYKFLYNENNFKDLQQLPMIDVFDFYGHVLDPDFIDKLNKLKIEMKERKDLPKVTIRFGANPRKMLIQNLLKSIENNKNDTNFIAKILAVLNNIDNDGNYLQKKDSDTDVSKSLPYQIKSPNIETSTKISDDIQDVSHYYDDYPESMKTITQRFQNSDVVNTNAAINTITQVPISGSTNPNHLAGNLHDSEIETFTMIPSFTSKNQNQQDLTISREDSSQDKSTANRQDNSQDTSTNNLLTDGFNSKVTQDLPSDELDLQKNLEVIFNDHPENKTSIEQQTLSQKEDTSFKNYFKNIKDYLTGNSKAPSSTVSSVDDLKDSGIDEMKKSNTKSIKVVVTPAEALKSIINNTNKSEKDIINMFNTMKSSKPNMTFSNFITSLYNDIISRKGDTDLEGTNTPKNDFPNSLSDILDSKRTKQMIDEMNYNPSKPKRIEETFSSILANKAVPDDSVSDSELVNEFINAANIRKRNDDVSDNIFNKDIPKSFDKILNSKDKTLMDFGSTYETKLEPKMGPEEKLRSVLNNKLVTDEKIIDVVNEYKRLANVDGRKPTVDNIVNYLYDKVTPKENRPDLITSDSTLGNTDSNSVSVKDQLKSVLENKLVTNDQINDLHKQFDILRSGGENSFQPLLNNLYDKIRKADNSLSQLPKLENLNGKRISEKYITNVDNTYPDEDKFQPSNTEEKIQSILTNRLIPDDELIDIAKEYKKEAEKEGKNINFDDLVDFLYESIPTSPDKPNDRFENNLSKSSPYNLNGKRRNLDNNEDINSDPTKFPTYKKKLQAVLKNKIVPEEEVINLFKTYKKEIEKDGRKPNYEQLVNVLYENLGRDINPLNPIHSEIDDPFVLSELLNQRSNLEPKENFKFKGIPKNLKKKINRLVKNNIISKPEIIDLYNALKHGPKGRKETKRFTILVNTLNDLVPTPQTYLESPHSLTSILNSKKIGVGHKIPKTTNPVEDKLKLLLENKILSDEDIVELFKELKELPQGNKKSLNINEYLDWVYKTLNDTFNLKNILKPVPTNVKKSPRRSYVYPNNGYQLPSSNTNYETSKLLRPIKSYGHIPYHSYHNHIPTPIYPLQNPDPLSTIWYNLWDCTENHDKNEPPHSFSPSTTLDYLQDDYDNLLNLDSNSENLKQRTQKIYQQMKATENPNYDKYSRHEDETISEQNLNTRKFLGSGMFANFLQNKVKDMRKKLLTYTKDTIIPYLEDTSKKSDEIKLRTLLDAKTEINEQTTFNIMSTTATIPEPTDFTEKTRIKKIESATNTLIQENVNLPVTTGSQKHFENDLQTTNINNLQEEGSKTSTFGTMAIDAEQMGNMKQNEGQVANSGQIQIKHTSKITNLSNS